MIRRRLTQYTLGLGTLAAVTALVVRSAILPLPDTLLPESLAPKKRQVLDRLGVPLSYTFTSEWNTTNHIPLHRIPPLLQRACIEAEDRRFFEHSGVDWWARTHATWQNIRALTVVRGASTISEQVVRMIHPRPRSLWARFIEGFEATQLEQRFSKADILEFYLNQVPFAGNRRGVSQAARYFWDRDLETLTERELISLAVMIRAPGKLSLYRTTPQRLQPRVVTLAERLVSTGTLPRSELTRIVNEHTQTRSEAVSVRADHFVRYVQRPNSKGESSSPIHSTLDSGLQRAVQEILETRLKDLAFQHATDGAVLVVDNRSAEVLAWVNAGVFSEQRGSQLDAVITPRQPGSTLKPFLYALALQKGWSAATTISDTPLAEPVGTGLHTYRNYSRVHYGEITLRESLGNSLNIPAIRTIQFTGKDHFLTLLRSAGFSSLTEPADFYGEGLALGNGEVTLFELVRGYLTFANSGVYRPLVMTRDQVNVPATRHLRIFDTETASIIGNILSDPQARRLEFGSDGLLNFPIQTAIKTGTSTDYRDAWALGFSNNFTVGVWMGNLDRSSMSSISGARGPALVLRSVFASLEQNREARGLYLSPRLTRSAVCTVSGKLASGLCPSTSELFVPGTEPRNACRKGHTHDDFAGKREVELEASLPARITMPTPGLHIAMDPRVPDSKEALAFEISTATPLATVAWIVDGLTVHRGDGQGTRYLWPLSPGRHTVRAEVQPVYSSEPVELPEVVFWVR
jgi:penicillin-binding protein 1C